MLISGHSQCSFYDIYSSHLSTDPEQLRDELDCPQQTRQRYLLLLHVDLAHQVKYFNDQKVSIIDHQKVFDLTQYMT